MKRILCMLLCAAMLMGILSGCDQGGKTPHVPTGSGLTWDDDESTTPDETQPHEQELEMVYYPDISMNPLQCKDFTNRALFSLLYQGLFATDRDYNVVPILCERYTVSADMRVYTFYVTDATFSDGSRLAPVDVYATLDAAIDSPVYGGRFDHVYDIELQDDGGITIRLDTPYENLPILLDVPILKDTELTEDYPLGTGPYLLDETPIGTRLLRRENWWCKAELAINASSIPLREAKSPAQIRDAFEFSNVGLVCADPNSDTYADFRCDYELWDFENGNFLFLACNVNGVYFSDSNLRSSLTFAINRTAITDKYYQGFARSVTLPASPESPYYTTSLANRYEYEPELFARALDDAKIPLVETEEGTREIPAMIFLVNKDDSLRLRVAREIRDMLEYCGMKVEMLEADYENFIETLEKGEYDLYLGQTRLSPNMDLSVFFAIDGNINYGGMYDPTLYSRCLAALSNRGNYYNLHADVANDGRLCPILFQSYAVYAIRGLASRLTPARDNLFYYDLGRTLADALTDD